MNKLNLIVLVVACAVSAAITYKLTYTPPSVITENRSQNNTDIVTVIREVKSPAGQITKDITITDKSVKSNIKTLTVTPEKPNYMLTTEYDLTNRSYVLGGGYRVIGNFYATASYNTNGSVLVGLAVTF